ncbi:methyltransferase domain-containing protein [Phenylobacterium kunshanense]|nr:methyltransferase domain-containing protein [Phenylobacterium kunshanense]
MSRTTNTGRRPGWHWSEYWQSGRTEIMTIGTEGGEIVFDPGASWRAFFGSFDAGARLIDLATGGGQVARLAHEVGAATDKGFDVVGVDYADLGPSGGDVAPGLRLIGGVALERLPFDDASFDGAASQFGIEYADTRLALGELARVLKSGGRARLLVHSTESAVSQSTAAQSAAHDRVMPDDALIQKARRAFNAHMRRSPRDVLSAQEQALREAVQKAAAKIVDDAAYDPVRYHLDYLADLARGVARYEPRSALARLDVFEAGVAAWRQRHRSQMKAALDRPGLDAFLDRAVRKGLRPLESGGETDARGALVAWRVDLIRD